MQQTSVRDKWMDVQGYDDILDKSLENISDIYDAVNMNTTTKKSRKKSLHREVCRYIKIWATPMMQRVIKSGQISRFW